MSFKELVFVQAVNSEGKEKKNRIIRIVSSESNFLLSYPNMRKY